MFEFRFVNQSRGIEPSVLTGDLTEQKADLFSSLTGNLFEVKSMGIMQRMSTGLLIPFS